MSIAVVQAASLPKAAAAQKYATGTVRTPKTADSERSPTSPVPNTCAHGHAMQ